MAKIYLTRHGQTIWNEEGRLQGSQNSELTKLGLQQAMWLSKALADVEFEKIYSSPLERALMTADLIRGDRKQPINTLENLKECNFGIWEGWKIEEINDKFPDEAHYFWNEPEKYQPIDGETFDSVEKRVIPIIEMIGREHEGNVLVVAHGIVVKIIMSHYMGQDISTLWKNFVKPTSLSILRIDDSQKEVLLYGDTSHYENY